MRTVVLLSPLLLAACVPAEVVRSKAGLLAYRTQRGIVILEPDLSVHRRVDPLPVEGGRCQALWLDWSPDGRALAFAGRCGEERSILGLLDPATGEVRVLVQHAKASLWFPRWSPDGTRIGYVRDAGDWEKEFETELRVVRVEDGSDRVVAERCGLLHAWSPDGKTIALLRTGKVTLDDDSLAPGTLAELDLAKGESATRAAVMFSPFSQVAYDRSGRILLSTPRLPAVGTDVRFALYSFRSKELDLVREEVTYRAVSPAGERELLLVPHEGEFLKGGVHVRGEGLEGTVDLGEQSGDLLPFWLDEDRIGFRLEEKRIVVHDLRTGSRVDITGKLAGIDFHDD